MSLNEKIENLRKKPIETRKRIVFTILGIFGLLLVVFWILTFRYRHTPTDGIGFGSIIRSFNSTSSSYSPAPTR